MRNRSLSLSLLLLMLAALALATGGCIFSPDDDNHTDVDPPTPLPFPDTPEQLMANFKTVYTEMDFIRYRDEILSPDYLFVLQESTVEDFELPDNLFEYTDELRIAGKMFGGQPNSLNQVLSAIEIPTLQPQGAWLPVPDTDSYFGGVGALSCNYNLLTYFNMRSDLRYEVRGNTTFYVVATQEMRDGVLTPRYRLLGQLDQTMSKAAPAEVVLK